MPQEASSSSDWILYKGLDGFNVFSYPTFELSHGGRTHQVEISSKEEFDSKSSILRTSFFEKTNCSNQFVNKLLLEA